MLLLDDPGMPDTQVLFDFVVIQKSLNFGSTLIN